MCMISMFKVRGKKNIILNIIIIILTQFSDWRARVSFVSCLSLCTPEMHTEIELPDSLATIHQIELPVPLATIHPSNPHTKFINLPEGRFTKKVFNWGKGAQ